jgi:hypothetical protein
VELVGLDAGSAQLGDAAGRGSLAAQPAGELAEHAFDADHRAGTQGQPHLIDIAKQRRSQPRRCCGTRGSAGGALIRMRLARRDVDHACVEQGRLGAKQGSSQRPDAVRVGAVPADRGDHLLAPGVERGLGQLVRGKPGQHRGLGHRGPLQHGGARAEAELGGGCGEHGVKGGVVAGGDFAEVGAAEHKVVRSRPQPASDHQPADDAPALTVAGLIWHARPRGH